MTSGQDCGIILVYAPAQNAFYTNLAKRLFLACREAGARVKLVSSDSMHRLSSEEIRGSSAVLVNPLDLIHDLSDRKEFYRTISKFQERIMILAEAIETRWFSQQFSLPVSINTLVDVGFVSQQSKMKDHGFSHIPYRFLFNGLTKREWERLVTEKPEESRRPIPWALIGHKTLERVKLARWLAEEVSANGTIFLPDQGRGMRPGSGSISSLGMDLILKRTKYYVWMPHHEFAYYESFRFRDAVLNGAVPIKLDRDFHSEHSCVPGIVSTREELAQFMSEGSYEQTYEASRAYYLDQNALEDEVRGVLLSEL
jgi:hypothetical protein